METGRTVNTNLNEQTLDIPTSRIHWILKKRKLYPCKIYLVQSDFVILFQTGLSKQLSNNLSHTI